MYKPNKQLGQNFLIRKDIAYKMVDALDIETGDQIVEIGPGLGALTEVISQKTSEIKAETYAIEIDDRFVEKLNNMFLENLNLNIIKADILKWLPKFKAKLGFKIIGSLPYYITSPIIHAAVKHFSAPSKCVFLVQKEVAHKIKDLDPNGSYLSNFIQAFYDVKILGKVPPEYFKPRPGVDSSILVLTRKLVPLVSLSDVKKYEGLLHKGFSNPRKMLNKVFTKEELELAGISPSDRAQNVSIEKWAKLFEKLN